MDIRNDKTFLVGRKQPQLESMPDAAWPVDWSYVGHAGCHAQQRARI